MAIDVTAPPDAGRTLLYDALAQNDVDMQHHRLLNLDTSNLPPVGIPPTIHPPENKWLHDWDSTSHTWTATQPSFRHLEGFMTDEQKLNINMLGVVRRGTWQASPIGASYLPPLNLILPPTDNVSMAGRKLVNLGNPANPQDAVTLSYMDFLLQGLVPKEAVKCATTSRADGVSGLDPIDNVPIEAGDRVLVKDLDSTGGIANGIYIASSGSWSRAPDATTANDPGTGLERAYVVVLGGDLNAGTSWVQINDLTDPLGTIGDDIHFVQFSAAPDVILDIIAGAGLNRDGNTLSVEGTAGRIIVHSGEVPAPNGVDIDPAWPGQTSITKLGVIDTGTWNGDVILSSRGGTGVDNHDRTITLIDADFSVQHTGIAVPDSGLVLQIGAGFSVVNVPSAGTLATLDQPEIFTNKRIVKRTGSIASNAKPSINFSLVDAFYISNLMENITSMSDNLTGGLANEGQELEIWICDQGAGLPRNIAWGTKYDAAPSLPLPVVTTTGWMFMRFLYHAGKSKWVLTENLKSIPL